MCATAPPQRKKVAKLIFKKGKKRQGNAVANREKIEKTLKKKAARDNLATYALCSFGAAWRTRANKRMQ